MGIGSKNGSRPESSIKKSDNNPLKSSFGGNDQKGVLIYKGKIDLK